MEQFILDLIEALGGGLSATVIVGLAAAVILLWRRNNNITDARLEDMRQHSKEILDEARRHEEQMAANTATLNQALMVLEAKSNV